MAHLAFQGVAPLEISDLELKRAAQSGGPSFSFDTISDLRRDHRELAFVIGADQLRDLPRWHRFPEILGLCHWIVLSRKPDGDAVAEQALSQWEGSGLAKKSPTPGQWLLDARLNQKVGATLVVVPTAAPALSSTQIREVLGRTGEAPENTLSEPVRGYLKRVGLYGTEKATL